MKIPTEPIGSIPRTAELVEAISAQTIQNDLEKLYDRAVKDTLIEFEKTGSPVITDGEQSKASFVTYPLHGLPNLNPDGIKIGFADGHFRQLHQLMKGPFRYHNYAVQYLKAARYIPVNQLGTTDDFGFSPFCDDKSTTRETAFAKIRSRIEGTKLAEQILTDIN